MLGPAVQSNDQSPLVGAVAHTVDQLQGNAHHAIDAIADATNSAAASIGARGEKLHDVQVRITDSCVRQVRDHPMATLGIAVALGALLGWSLRSL
jgi:ElaB/YqjD/DUF883 family membrane-anchored ribosome-binding protein